MFRFLEIKITLMEEPFNEIAMPGFPWGLQAENGEVSIIQTVDNCRIIFSYRFADIFHVNLHTMIER
ncbi:hypothetical protein ES705_48214 [subsurface metagenome]